MRRMAAGLTVGELDEGERFQLLPSLSSCANVWLCALSSSLSSLWCKVKAGRDRALRLVE